MDERDYLVLKYFQEEQNLTNVAKRLHLTQPSLTYRIQQIEKEFQIKLFIREGRNLKITPEGEHLADYARKALVELERIKDSLANMRNEVKGNLRIGVNSYFGLHELPSLLQTFIKEFPEVYLHVKTGLSSEIFGLLEDNEIDVGIIREEYNWYEHKYLLREEDICLISKEVIDFDELPKTPMVRYKLPNVGIKYKNTSSLTQSIDRWWHEIFEEPPHVSMEADSFETCKELVKKGFGYSIIPSAFLTSSDKLYSSKLFFKDNQPLKRKTWMLYREAALQVAPANRFIHFIRNTYS